MILPRILRTNPRYGILLALTAISVVSASALDYVGLAPWASVLSNKTPDVVRKSAEPEASFLTLSEFIERSPGERGEVNALKGKGLITSKLAALQDEPAAGPPSQRALGKIFDPEPFDIAAAEENPIVFLTAPIAGIGTPQGLVPLGSATGASSGFPSGAGSIPGSFAVAPPISSSPGGGGGGGGSDNPAPPSIGAVPEPSTWLLILMGFFSVGFALRRRQAPAMHRNEPVSS